MSSTNPCTTINANSDVLGKAVRINFYITMILLDVIPRARATEELLNALNAIAGLSSLGLLLTAIIQTALNQLSIFEGLFVFHVLYFLITVATTSNKAHWSKGRFVTGLFIRSASLAAFVGWGLYFWIRVKDFGTQPGCNLNNQVKYVIVFKDVPVTAAWLRGLCIAIIAVIGVGPMIGFAYTAVYLFAIAKRSEEEDGAEQATSREPQDDNESWSCELSFPCNPVAFAVSLLKPSIYITIMLELMMHRNAAHFENGTNIGPGVVQIHDSWQLGQTLSVVMIMAILTEFVRFILGALGISARRRRDMPASV
ncbi:hypothetical protein BC827DRAFT_1161358 [Russula dissimulans]|nr:hypothetical protein BC827DRAFT_1161358 [Russula dissimulans]